MEKKTIEIKHDCESYRNKNRKKNKCKRNLQRMYWLLSVSTIMPINFDLYLKIVLTLTIEKESEKKTIFEQQT